MLRDREQRSTMLPVIEHTFECVKCGLSRADGSDACPTCTWPFTLEAWRKTTYQIRRVTLDTCCINSRQRHSSLNKLEEWNTQGHIELQRAYEMLNELAKPGGEKFLQKASTFSDHPPLFILGSSFLDSGHVLAGPDWWLTIKNALFPRPQITHRQHSDIEHLRQHVRTGGDVFVTLNTKDFINHGKQETLQHLGIWVFDPDALVVFLQDRYRWS